MRKTWKRVAVFNVFIIFHVLKKYFQKINIYYFDPKKGDFVVGRKVTAFYGIFAFAKGRK